jgi:hypothetical protein
VYDIAVFEVTEVVMSREERYRFVINDCDLFVIQREL